MAFGRLIRKRNFCFTTLTSMKVNFATQFSESLADEARKPKGSMVLTITRSTTIAADSWGATASTFAASQLGLFNSVNARTNKLNVA